MINRSLTSKLRQLLRLVNLRNARTLWRALQQEPIGHIAGNFRQVVKTGRPQRSRILWEEDHIKIYVHDCRKEAGQLKLVIWVLTNGQVRNLSLLAGEEKLHPQIHTFIRPELEAVFSSLPGFTQQGFILQCATEEPLSVVQLELSDDQERQIRLPVGRHFLYAPATNGLPEQPAQVKSTILTHRSVYADPAGLRSTKPAGYQHKFLLLLHDWGLPENADHAAIKKLSPDRFAGFDVAILSIHSGKWVDLQNEQEYDPTELNDLLSARTFDYLVFLSVTSLPATELLSRLTSFCSDQADAALVYFDEELLEGAGACHSPRLKPAFSPERLEAENYIGTNYCISKRLGDQAGWFSPADRLCGGYDLLLRSLPKLSAAYRLSGLRLQQAEQSRAVHLRRAAAEQSIRQEHFKKRQITVRPGVVPEAGEVLRPLSSSALVSIIIPFKDRIDLLERCLQSLSAHTSYPHFEVLLVSNNSEDQATYRFLEAACRLEGRFRMLRWDHPFNYAALNNWAAAQARGEVLLFLNNDVEFITENWLTRMLSYLEVPEVGAVGVKLLYPDHTVQHAGVLVGYGGWAAHPFKHFPDDYGGYDNRANKVQNVSACTAACLLVRRKLFEETGGFDAVHLPIAFNDVDLCLEIRKRGYRIVYTPFVKLIHYESISRGAEDTPEKRRRARREIAWFRKKWRTVIRAGDPYYHPELSLRRSDFEVIA